MITRLLFLSLLHLFVVSFCSCSKSKKTILNYDNDSYKTILVPNIINRDDVNIIDNLEYIVLEEKDNSFFGHVSKLRIHQNRIYVLDIRYANALFIYTSEGKHIATIGDKKGQGPLELIGVNNFEIDYANNQLLVMDNFGYKFMIYDLEGRFIKRINSNIPVTQAVLLPNGYIMHAKASFDYKKFYQGNCCIIITDENKRIIREGFYYDDNPNINLISPSIIYSSPDGSFNFAPKFRDTIYSVSLDSIIPKYAINYGNNRKLSKSVIDDLPSSMDLFQLMYNGNLCFIGDHVESKEYLYLKLSDVIVFFNKQTNNTIAISNKIKGKAVEFEIYEILCSDNDGYFYGAFNLAKRDELIMLFPEIKELFQSRDLNPILFRYKVKNEI